MITLSQWGLSWPRIQRLLTAALLVFGLVQLVGLLRELDWRGMAEAIVSYPAAPLWLAAALTIASYAVYASYDLLGCRHVGLPLGRGRVFVIGLICHAYGLSLGPAAAAFRFRLYMRLGVGAKATAAVWLVTIATNWLGFLVLAGVAFAARVVTPPPDWPVAAGALQAFGVALLLLAGVCFALCASTRRRTWQVRGRTLRLPSLRFAVLQCVLSVANWLLIAAILFALLQGAVDFGPLLGALMASALALAVVDVPGGLGVTEVVFLALLGGEVASAQLLAALVAYRGICFVAPLLVATPAYLAIEWLGRGTPTPPGRGLG